MLTTTHHCRLGDIRDRVRAIAESLCLKINVPDTHTSVFYDENHRAELARPNLDLYLLDIYRNKTRLIVVFMCNDYQLKEWCGLEARAVCSLLLSRQDARIMLLTIDGGVIDGILNIDGYMDIRQMTTDAVAEAIYIRLRTLGEPLPPARYPHGSFQPMVDMATRPTDCVAWRDLLYMISPWYLVIALLAYIIGAFVGR